MCKVLNVSRSCYYRWYNGGVSKREKENQDLSLIITEVFEDSKQRYGSPRIAAELRRRGVFVSRPRVAKIMRYNGLRSKVKKQHRVTTNSNHKLAVSENLLNRNFNPTGLNQAWVSDITYIRTLEGWLYLTTIIDLFDRQVIGWSLSKTLFTKETIIPAWKMAISKRKINQKLIFHSDRGIQYASHKFRNILSLNKHVYQSMSRKGNCWDNAVAESFFKSLKSELIYHEEYKTIEHAEQEVFEYMEVWYNRKRLHSALGYKTPIEIENEFNNVA